MIETRVRVIRADQDTAWVEPTEQGGCEACQTKAACGLSNVTSGLGRYFSHRRRAIPVCVANARPGEHLTVVMSEADFLKAGVLAYLLPTLLAVAGAAGVSISGAGDAWTALGMALGFAAGILLANRLARPLPLAVGTDPLSSNQGEAP